MRGKLEQNMRRKLEQTMGGKLEQMEKRMKTFVQEEIAVGKANPIPECPVCFQELKPPTKIVQCLKVGGEHSGLPQWGEGGSEGMSEICSNCEIFNTGRSHGAYFCKPDTFF